jgi:hypothetical protein
VEGFWANWPDKARTPGVIELACGEHAGRPALRCTFSPTPRVPWSNINSPAFEVGDASAVDVTYAGDGTPRTVYAVLHAPPRFYRYALPLDSKDWIRKRLSLSDFRDERDKPFEPTAATHAVSFQLAPASGESASPPTATPATLWLHTVSLANDAPVKELWRSAAAFDDVEVDNLLAEHKPRPPPPAVAARQPLVRFSDPAPKLLANWDGKGAADATPLITVERVARAEGAPFLRVTFPAGECAWGNANIPLPSAKLKDADGLALRLRASPSDDVALALHTASPAGQRFFRADAETAEAWVDVVLPWSLFLGDDGKPFAPASAAWLNLQLCRPAHVLKSDLVIEIESVDAIIVKR